MITSKIRIPRDGIFSEHQTEFLTRVMFVALQAPEIFKEYFQQHFWGRTVFGNLLLMEKATSLEKLYEIFFQKEGMLFNIGYVPPVFGTFLYQERENSFFPQMGKIWTLTKNPLLDTIPGSGEIF